MEALHTLICMEFLNPKPAALGEGRDQRSWVQVLGLCMFWALCAMGVQILVGLRFRVQFWELGFYITWFAWPYS